MSYNELEKVFNGWYAYDHDIYITFDKRVFVPCCGISDILINCPVIFSGDSVSVQIYQYFEYQILATEDPINYRADNLPGTLNINTNTGLIYGVIETPGTYTITVWAENEECYDTLDIVVTANIDQLYGISIGIAVVTGFLSGKVNIEGVSNGSATVTGTLTYAHSQITATADGVATVTATIIGRVAIFGTIDAGATVNGEMQLFNFFFGGTESTIPDKYTLARMYDAGNAGGSSVAFWQGSAIKIWDRNHYHGADYPYIDEIQVWVTAKKFMFYVDTFFNNQKLTWAIDVGGNCDIINQGAFSRAGQLKWVYLPTARMIHGPSGYFTFGNNFSMRGYIDFRNVRGLGWNENLYGGYSSNQHMNHIFNNAYGITTLNFAKLEEITLQWSNRSNLQNITALKRFYAPLLRYCAAACSSYPYYNPTVDDRKTTRIGGGTTSGVGKIFYLSPEMATSRRSDAIITVDAAVPAGATVEINGLTYTAVIGAPANSTEFQTGFVTTFPHKNCITSLINAVHSDTRIGAYGGYQQRDIIQIVNTLLSDGPPAKGLIRAKIDGAGPDVITCSVSGAGLYVSAPTLMYGGTPDRTLVHWIDTGTEIRYVTSFENPNAVTDLSASNITKDSFVLNFTPPPITVNPLDFYEVWVYDGSTLEYLFVPYQEITGSGDMVIGLNPGRQYKVKIVTRDYFYNGSEFSNEIIVQMQLDEEINSIATVTGTMYRKNTATGNAMIDGIINGSSSHISVLEDRIDTEGFTELTGTLTAIGSLEGTTNGLTIIEAVL